MEIYKFGEIDSKNIYNELKNNSCMLINLNHIKYYDYFIKEMEKYFSQPSEKKYYDCSPDRYWQSGYIPAYMYRPPNTDNLYFSDNNDYPYESLSTDNNEKYSWKLYKNLNESKQYFTEPDTCVPNNNKKLNNFGICIYDKIESILTKLSIGLGIDDDFLTNIIKDGPSTLSTFCYDVIDRKHNRSAKGYSNELSLITVFCPSVYNHINIWTTNTRKKISVTIPDNCILIQAGLQLEYLTGGTIQAGYNEIVISNDIDRKSNNYSTLNIIPTLNIQCNNKCQLSIIDKFNNNKVISEYPSINKGEWLKNELTHRY